MVLLSTPVASLGWQAEDFRLMNVDGEYYSLSQARGEKGIVIAFICNHCPYVISVMDAIVKTAHALRKIKMGFVAIMPNDFIKYPDDSFEKMKIFADDHSLPFPYLLDDTQAAAKSYGAVCTPDFFAFDCDLKLRYRGCIVNKITKKNDLLNAGIEIVDTGSSTIAEHPSMGCSIKWK